MQKTLKCMRLMINCRNNKYFGCVVPHADISISENIVYLNSICSIQVFIISGGARRVFAICIFVLYGVCLFLLHRMRSMYHPIFFFSSFTE